MNAQFRLAKTIRFLCDLGIGLLIAGTATSIFWFLLLPPITGTRPVIKASVNVGVEESVPVVSSQSEALISPKFSKITGELQFQTRDWRVQALTQLGRIVLVLLIMGFLYSTRQFMTRTMEGTPFTFGNARCLQSMGWLVMGIGLAQPATDYLISHWVLSIAKIQSPFLSPWISPAFTVICFMVAAFILILAAIFRHGVELENERSLTV
jgi:hypothetical protein